MAPPRRLILLRHARPEPLGPGSDLERDLLPDGLLQARRVGAWLRDSRLVPETVLSSPARRCLRTAETVVLALGGDPAPAVRTCPELGEADGEAGLTLIAPLVGTTLLVSHHPTLLSLGAALAGAAGVADLRPAGLLILEEGPDGRWTAGLRFAG